jgi:hypothetical protein
MVVGYSREELDIDGESVIAHQFPCQECDASALIWDDDVNYKDIK